MFCFLYRYLYNFLLHTISHLIKWLVPLTTALSFFEETRIFSEVEEYLKLDYQHIQISSTFVKLKFRKSQKDLKIIPTLEVRKFHFIVFLLLLCFYHYFENQYFRTFCIYFRKIPKNFVNVNFVFKYFEYFEKYFLSDKKLWTNLFEYFN